MTYDTNAISRTARPYAPSECHTGDSFRVNDYEKWITEMVATIYDVMRPYIHNDEIRNAASQMYETIIFA